MENRLKYLKKLKTVSKFDSENLMYALIKDVLHENDYSAMELICHQPLNMLIRATYLDFLIYNRISKKPVLSIEVDGFHYHKKGTVQSERDKKKNRILQLYRIPYLRFAANQSGEKEKLTERLKEVLN